MNTIEIKSLRVIKSMSQETLCFSANVYVNGKIFCVVSNHGHGGCNDYDPKKGTSSDMRKQIDEMFGSFDNFDSAVDKLINDAYSEQQCKSILKSVVYITPECRGGEYYRTKLKPSEKTINTIKQQKWWKDGYIVLNELPLNEVIDKLKL